jgi:L-asparaginase II
LRSSAKPFQALPLLEHGGQAAFGLTEREIALICGSHSGTDEQVAAVQAIQTKTGVKETDLLCGVHAPYHKPTADALRQRGEKPTANRHNCSGKHTGMIAYARLLGLPYDDYINPAHPIQQDILQTFSEMCDLPADQVKVAIDGCSAPNFAVPMHNAALAFARLCDPVQLDPQRTEVCRTIVAAMIANPDMVGGPDSFDTHLMQAMRGRVLCKGGAEGFLAMGVLPNVLGPGSPGLGITIKISDGDLASHSRSAAGSRGTARPAVALEVLRQLSVISPDELNSLAGYGPSFEILNWRKLLVGEGYPCFKLQTSP